MQIGEDAPGQRVEVLVVHERRFRANGLLRVTVSGTPAAPCHDVGQGARCGDLVDADTAAIDRYTFIRNAYLQRRRYLVYDGKPPPEKEE